MSFIYVELLIVYRSTKAGFSSRNESWDCCPAEPFEGITHCVEICICIYIGLRAQVPLASAGFLNTIDKVYPHKRESLGTHLMTSWSEMDHSQGKKCTVAHQKNSIT